MRTLTAFVLALLLSGPVIPVRAEPDERVAAAVSVVAPSQGASRLGEAGGRSGVRSGDAAWSGGAGGRPARPVRPRVSVPESPVIAVVRPLAVDAGRRVQGAVRGTGSWFCGHGSDCTRGYPGGLYAAAGPALRLGAWRGRSVLVGANGRTVRVTLIDWCQCYGARVVDLYTDVWAALGVPLSRGLVRVTVTW